MREQIIKICAFAILGAIIGYLLHPVFNRLEPPGNVNVVADTLFMESAPDTVWKISYVKHTVTVFKDTGSTVYIPSGIPGVNTPNAKPVDLFWSYEKFQPNKYVTSEVYAVAPDSVLWFRNNVVVLWDKHYDEVIKPNLGIVYSDQKRVSLIKGLAAGAFIAAGVATGRWEYAAGGVAVASGIIILF